MHPYSIANSLETNGFWYSYWSIREIYVIPRTHVLWLIWVAYNYKRHRDKMFDDGVRVLTK